jgi:glycosyltransferase involved in cell wall biosynthesis
LLAGVLQVESVPAKVKMRFFDITRLCNSAESKGPSGIDRVDLAYLQWLRSIGPVGYLVHGKAGFSQVDGRLGGAYADKLESAWKGKTEGLNPRQLRPLRDTTQRLRLAVKWRARRAELESLYAVKTLAGLCEQGGKDLELLDASAGAGAYRVEASWRRNDKSGCFFGISHGMLTRTAYLAALAKHKNLKRVFFIHDTIPCDFPEYCRDYEGAKHLLRLRNTFRHASHVVVNSEYTRQRLEHWRLQLGGAEVPVEVIPIGVDEGLRAFANYGFSLFPPKRPYFVILGTIEPRKNHGLLLHLWRHFAATLPAGEVPELVIVGRRGWHNESVTRMLDRSEWLDGHVREMNGVLDDELWPLLRDARAVLFPSFVEGWGMPMVEALALGVPVIGSDIPAFREAGQGVPELICPLDGNLWAERIREYARENSAGRLGQLERLERYSPPTWQRHFAKVEAMLGSEALGLVHGG